MTTSNNCRHHPGTRAEYICNACMAPICESCIRTTDAGAIVCPNCEKPADELDTLDTREPDYDLAQPAAPAPQVYTPPVSGYAQPRQLRSYFGKCANHPDADATQTCANCRAKICATCDFAFPGNIHLCPACATNPKQGLTRKRKSMTFTSLTLGIFNLIGSGLVVILPLMSGGIHDQETLQMVGCFIMLVLVSALTGTILGFSAFRSGSQNPFYIWIGPILNSLIGLIWIGLMIKGAMR